MLDFIEKFKTQIKNYLVKLPPLSYEYKKLISEYLYYLVIAFCIYTVYYLIFTNRFRIYNNWSINFIDFSSMILILVILIKNLNNLKQKKQQGLTALINTGIIFMIKEILIAFVSFDFIGMLIPIIIFIAFYYLILQIEEFYF
ncbi:MAG: hypothetical protein KatS3mg090_0696 [Patescibacteria group bacterium]|nr:MAG: hypothetical protein KatS3mg090_0696 [Patescibacteria group bacterium]